MFNGLKATLLEAFATEQALGWDVTVAWLVARLMSPGVQRVDLTSPTGDVVVANNRAAVLGTVTLTLAGRDW